MKTHNKLNKRHLPAFTLIELMVVVTIIVILSGLTIGIAGWVQRKAAVSKAETQLKLLETQLENYKADTGGFPVVLDPSGVDKTGLILYKVLFGDGVGLDGIPDNGDQNENLDGRPDEGAKIYLADLDPNSNTLQMVQVRAGGVPTKLVDPFGFSWRYRQGGTLTSMNPDFDIWSVGPDGKEGTPDDIKNW